jgi:protein-tyrosine phosphatase
MEKYRRLPLEGLLNARELGGYPTPGGTTRYGVFVRAEVPRVLTEADKQFLQAYGITTDIDFRGDRELKKVKDALADEPWLNYVHLPIYDEAAAHGRAPDGRALLSQTDFCWGEHYIAMVEGNKGWILRVLTAMAAADGGVLFHCTTGKDRTGIITAVLLGLCDVAPADIAADYCVSQVYLRPMYRQMEHYYDDGGDVGNLDPFYNTAAENMEMLLQHIGTKYGSMADYLLSCGASKPLLETLRNRLS